MESTEKSLRRYYAKRLTPLSVPVMIRIHYLQLFYNLSDREKEGTLYEIESMRSSAGLRVTGSIPDETTILNFLHQLEKHCLGDKVFKIINKYLEKEGVILKEGAIVDTSDSKRQ